MKIINSSDLLSFLSEYLPANPTIIEAGAFNGIDTKKMALQWPQATIHAFEPVPEIFDELVKETTSYSQIKCYPLALSNKIGTTTFYVSCHPRRPERICQAGSLHKPKDRLTASPITYPRTITVETSSLHEWATTYEVNGADLIWLDMQGHELTVLQGSPQFIQKASIIYLEVNFIAAYENQPTEQEIISWMEMQGFIAIARDFNDNPHRFFGNIFFLNTAKQ